MRLIGLQMLQAARTQRFFLGVALALCASVGGASGFPLHVRQVFKIETGSQVFSIAWSPDGSRLAAIDDFATEVVVWDGAGRKLSAFPGGGGNPASPLAFVGGSSQLIVRPPDGAPDDVLLSIYDAATGKLIKNVTAGSVGGGARVYYQSDFAVSPDQTLLAVETGIRGEGDRISIASVGDGVLTKSYAVGAGLGAINFLARGSRVVVGSVDDLVGIFDPRSGPPVRLFPALQRDTSMGSVAGSPDGSFIFVGGSFVEPYVYRHIGPRLPGDNVHVVRVSDGLVVASFPGSPGGLIFDAQWDPLARYVAFIDHDANTLYLWRPLARPLSYEKLHIPGAVVFAISQDGSRIAVGGLHEITVFSVN